MRTEEIVSYMPRKHEELISFFVSDISVVENLNSQEESKLLDAALEEILEDEDVKRRFIQSVAELTKAYAVCTPHPSCLEVEPQLRFFQKMRRVMAKSISGVVYAPPGKESAVQELVEEGISANEKIRFYNVSYDEEKIDLNKEYIEKVLICLLPSGSSEPILTGLRFLTVRFSIAPS